MGHALPAFRPSPSKNSQMASGMLVSSPELAHFTQPFPRNIGYNFPTRMCAPSRAPVYLTPTYEILVCPCLLLNVATLTDPRSPLIEGEVAPPNPLSRRYRRVAPRGDVARCVVPALVALTQKFARYGQPFNVTGIRMSTSLAVDALLVATGRVSSCPYSLPAPPLFVATCALNTTPQ